MQISISNIVKGTVIGSAFTAISRYFTRVTQAGAIYEKPLCVESGINSSPLLQQASMLILPSGYKGGTAYAELPSNGNGDLTWTRGSDAFRTNASGLLQRVPWNLLQYSEAFDNAAWFKSQITITANTITSPDGNTNADTITTTNTFHSLAQSITVVPNMTYTFSFYALLGTMTDLKYSVYNLTGASNIVAPTSYYSQTNLTTWSRISITFTAPAGCTSVNIYPVRDSGVTGTVYIWGAQLVEGTTAQTYLPTTDRLNFPRLSYMYGSCPSVLLEPQRTNLALYSQQLDDVSWGKINSSVTANSTTSPDGTTNADTFTGDGTNNQHYIAGTTSGNITSGTTYTYSIYAKKNTNNFIQLWISNAFGGMFANFDLNNGVVGTLGIGSGGSNPTSSIQSVGNGWYRCSMTFVPTSTGAVGLLCIITTSASAPRAEANTLSTSVFLYGAQLEQGAYPTTYIPTTGSATATRVADSFSRNNIYTNGLISASGGTWFVEFRNNIAYRGDAAGDGIFLRTVGDTDNFRFYSDNTATSRIIIFKRVSNVNSQIYTTTTDTVKIAIKWNGSTADIFANGTKVVSATSFTATQLQEITTSITAVPKFIQQMALFPTPLSDTDCTTITSI